MAYWLMQSQSDVPDEDWWLSDKERALLAGLRFPKRRNDWRLGRWTAKQAAHFCISENIGQRRLADLEIFAAPDGAPQLFVNGIPASLSISLSHSERYGFCAIAKHGVALGCDLEFIQQHDENLAEDYFVDEEKALLLRFPGLRRDVALTLIWSGKEAALKALRQGLRLDTRSVVVSFNMPQGSENSWKALSVRCPESSRIFGGWWRASRGFVQTVVSDSPETPPIEVSRIVHR
jgi:4'-phosphopantetheinyl transferase